MKNKKYVLIVIIFVIIIIISSSVLIILHNKSQTSKLTREETVKAQEEVVNLVRNYVNGIENIKEYAQKNSKIEFTIKELKGIFEIDTSTFENLKYDCNENNSFIKYNNDYTKYQVILDCKTFKLD